MASENEQDHTGGVSREQAVPGSLPVNEASGKSGVQEKQQPSFFYTQEPEEDFALPRVDDPPHEQGGLSSPFVLPFQNSAAMQTLPKVEATGSQAAMGSSPSTLRKRQRGSFSLVKMALLLGVALVTVLGASLVVFAQPATPPTMTAKRPVQGGNPAPQTPSPSRPTPKATANPPAKPTTPPNPGQTLPGTEAPSMSDVPSMQLLDQLGWTNAGFTLGDAIEALRTGITFTDREMSYDYRNIGTLAKHGGTLTGSTFLLTSGGLTRFANNDVRVINNMLYEKIRAGKLIQQVVNAHSSLVQFQLTAVQGQQRQFVWVSVSFALLQSRIDPASGKRTEGLEHDPKTGQPLLHHMTVILLRVPLQDQGANAPMGGTGWLVNTYALDMQGLPAIATDPAL